MTLDQQRALALANARLRLQEQSPSESQPDEAEMIAGAPLTRFALGAASPFLGVAQLVSEAAGSKGVSEHLARLEQMKRRGMSVAAEVKKLAEGREVLAQLPGYDAAVADIDRKLTEYAHLPKDQIGFDVAGLLGTILSPATLAAMKIPAATTVLGRTGQGAAIGAGFGAVSPVTEQGDFGARKAAQIGTGAVIGGLIPPVIDVTRKGYEIGRNILDPFFPGGAERTAARLLSEASGSRRAAIEAQLAANRQFVSGSKPTAAEAAAPAQSAEFAAMQKIGEQRLPSEYGDIAKAQEAARMQAVRGIGKDTAALEAAELARGGQAKELYEKAFSTATHADPQLLKLAENPYFKDALPHAMKLAQAKGINAKQDLTQFLHYVKLGLDKELAKTGDTALSATEKGTVMSVKKRLIDWLAGRNPAYNEARAAFAQASKPINVMQVGQQFEKALVKPIGEGERVGVFAQAVREAPQTIKRATGQARFEKLDEVLEAGDAQTIKDVVADLARKQEQTKLARLGAAKASEIMQPFSLPATGPLHQQYMIFKTLLGRVSKGTNEKTLDVIAEALQLPSTALRLLQKAPDAARNKVIDALISQKLGRGAIAAAASLAGEETQR